MAKPFNGAIDLDIRDSTPDWESFLADQAPDDAPNVLVVLYDDTGCAAWSPYGGRIEMPTLERLADGGLTSSQWHTTALCSPTRSVFLARRNHHQNGFASISETSTGLPGYNAHMPRENASMATVLRDAGWSTFWVGQNHNIPVDEWTMGSSKKDWPLGQGYDRFYGFIGGETNQWYPDLAEDNHHTRQPYSPDDGYHLSKDLADKALEFIRDSKQAEPGKPWYLWFCSGANHAPHHAPQEFIDVDNTLILYAADNGASGEGNFLGIPPEQRVVGDARTSGTHIVGIEFTKARSGEHHEAYGPVKLSIDDEVVAEEEIRTVASRYTPCGEGLCIGYDGGDAVSGEYTPAFDFTGGRIVKVVFDVADDAYVDVEAELAAAMARD